MTTLPDVLESCQAVAGGARFVGIDSQAARRWADTCTADALQMPTVPDELRFSGSRDDCANLVLLLDCLNFCFWSDGPWSVEFRGRTWRRTFAMYASVLRAVNHDAAWLQPQRWAEADADMVTRLFRGEGEIPLLEKRQEVLNETGRCLLEHFDGKFARAVERVGEARDLAYLLAERFPSFRDAPQYQGRTVALLKRAQLCVSDLHQTWTQCGYGGLEGIGRLTVFADYRLPQYLRHIEVLTLAPALAQRIDAGREIPAGSAEEVELRAATIVGGDVLRSALAARGMDLPAWHLDCVLWEHSHDPSVTVPHHRTRTIYY
ncbi:MAG: queuosine salvage family protein [Planctomycetota bacterium]